MAEKCSLVDTSLYAKYDVKRGLRDISGKGVLAGLTQVGEVVASKIVDDHTEPGPGQLNYRGYDIEKIVNGFTSENRLGFSETTYLLLFGELPSKDDLDSFNECISENRKLPRNFLHDAILKMSSTDIMNAMSMSVLALYANDKHPDDASVENVLRQCIKLIARMPLLAVYAYQAYVYTHQEKSLFLHSPKNGLSTAENILRMLRPDQRCTPLEVQLLDLALVLHAEHGGGNNSTFVTHVVSSSGTDTYSAIAAAMGSLKGPRHGGANIKVAKMFDDMKRKITDWSDDGLIMDYLGRILSKKEFDHAGLIYGIGHAVYSVSDPRSVILKKYARMLAEEKHLEDEFGLFEKVEALAPEAISRTRKMFKGVSANVDFYSGFVYRMLGIPSEMFTPLFAISRVVGWSAHRIEEIANPAKIVRPAYRSVSKHRIYIPMSNRRCSKSKSKIGNTFQ